MTQWNQAEDNLEADPNEVERSRTEQPQGSDVGGPDAALGSDIESGLSDDTGGPDNRPRGSEDAASS